MTEIVLPYEYVYEQQTVWVSVEWLMKNAYRSCDFGELDLAVMLERKCRDTGFGYLVESIMEHGFLEDGAIGYRDGEITEGHHRFAAAILLCLDRVPISPWGRDVMVMRAGISKRATYAHGHFEGQEPYPIAI